MVVVCVAGFLKLADLSEFASALKTWTLLPAWSVPLLTVTVPALECSVGGLWLVGHRRSRWSRACLVMLAAVTAAFVVQAAVTGPPECGCAGLLARYRLFQNAADHVVWRNAALITVLGVGLVLPSCQSWRFRLGGAMARRLARGRGFTLVEMLVVLVMVAVLAGLAASAAWRFRAASRSVGSMANLRSHAQVFATYASDYQGFAPYLTDPRLEKTTLSCASYTAQIVYFCVVNFWHVGLANEYYSGNHADRVFAHPGLPQSPFTHYNYSQAFLAHPDFWAQTSRVGPSQWRATRLADAVSPSRKALLVDAASEILRRSRSNVSDGSPVGFVFVDGSAREVPRSRILRGYPTGTGFWPGSWNSILWLGMHTIEGVRGLDEG